ncbi:MAG: STAS domain-containing protein [Chloroflexi bacterium]|nr:STAS domain-containing protein [Chloroflexota bacterium]
MDYSAIQKLENLLLVSVPRDLVDDDVIRMRRDILQAVRKYNSQIVLLDFSQVDICDSFFGRFIYSTAQMTKLMGAKIILSGLQDAVIETMVELGMALPDVDAVLDLDSALALSRAQAVQGSLVEGAASGPPEA